jgi:hypothetical protein
MGKNCQIFNITKLRGAKKNMNPSCDEYLKKKEEAISFQLIGSDLFCPPLVCVSTPMVHYIMWRMRTLLNQLIVSVS